MALSFSISLSAQKIAVKNNLVYDAALTPNLALEFGMAPKSTLDILGSYNWFNLGTTTRMEGNEEIKIDKKFKHWIVQPEWRFWSCERFNGFFWGIHLHGGEFNIGNTNMPFGVFDFAENYRYEGYFYGGGLSIGKQWILGKRWNFEASIGGGYARYHYDKYECGDCGKKVKDGAKNYFGVTKATLSFVYFLR